MELGMIGLGRMGGNMARRLLQGGHRVVAYAPKAEAVQAIVGQGGVGAASIADLATQLAAPRAVWIMVPAGEPTETTITTVAIADPTASRPNSSDSSGSSSPSLVSSEYSNWPTSLPSFFMVRYKCRSRPGSGSVTGPPPPGGPLPWWVRRESGRPGPSPPRPLQL